MTNASEIIGKINAMQTLVENFPMSILSLFQGKRYTNVIEFILDVLRQLGIDDIFIINKLIEEIFNVPNAVDIYQRVGSFSYAIIRKPTEEQKEQSILVEIQPTTASSTDSEYVKYKIGEDESGETIYNYYVKKDPFVDEELNSKFLSKLEEVIKPIIANIIAGILSCSVVPFIPDKYMDNAKRETRGLISIPLSLLDPYNLLSRCPTHYIGKNFYNVEPDLTVNTLYKTKDLNAFIWYVMNRGITAPQVEENKMMWDSRIVAASVGNQNRDTSDKWNHWINSKTISTETAESKVDKMTADMMLCPPNVYKDQAFDTYKDGHTLVMPLHPIMQLERESDITYDNERRLRVTISSQSFFKNDVNKPNKTIYEFNNEYLENIRIFSPKVILTNMLEELLNGSLTANLGLNYGINSDIINAKVNQIIKNAIEVDDTQVSDCYYSFSNEDFDEMLKQSELRKYSAKEVNDELVPAIKLDSNIGTDAIDSINSMATMHEKVSTITKTVYDISAIPAQDQQVSVYGSLALNYDSNWIINVISALINPIIRAIFSPQVILLFLIDFSMMGLVNMKDLNSLDLNAIMTILYRKLLSIFPSLIVWIKDQIVRILLDLYYKYVEPLILKLSILILQEQLNDWMKLLEEAMKCIPTFDFSKNGVIAQLDDVNYADIEQKQIIPEKNSGC